MLAFLLVIEDEVTRNKLEKIYIKYKKIAYWTAYNINFFNKGTTSKFYCSQLVWRSWKNQGFEVDRMNLGNYEPVSPAELVGGSGTYVFYHK